jgi:hypothetical protein
MGCRLPGQSDVGHTVSCRIGGAGQLLGRRQRRRCAYRTGAVAGWLSSGRMCASGAREVIWSGSSAAEMGPVCLLSQAIPREAPL